MLKQSVEDDISRTSRAQKSQDYLEDAYDNFLKDAVRFGNRDDFETFMRDMEKSYFEAVQVPHTPYVFDKLTQSKYSDRDPQAVPRYPARPQPTMADTQANDFCEQALEMHRLRRGIDDDEGKKSLDLSANKQEANLARISTTKPFMESTNKPVKVEKSWNLNKDQSYRQASLNKFIGGSMDLGDARAIGAAPESLMTSFAMPKKAPQPQFDPLTGTMIENQNEQDLTDHDAQHQRYKTLMSGQFYNTQANSFKLPFAGKPMSYSSVIQQQHSDMMPQLSQPQHANSTLPPGVKPMTGLQKPRTVQLYAEPATTKRPDYAGMTHSNKVQQAVIDSLGGIEDTIKPMQESMNKHELRPFDYLRNYADEIRSLKSGKGEVIGEPDVESMRIVSASPYRASIRIETPIKRSGRGTGNTDEDQNNSDDEEFARDGSQRNTFLSTYNKDRESPIKEDSESMRAMGDDYLQNLVRSKSPKVGTERTLNNSRSPGAASRQADNFSASAKKVHNVSTNLIPNSALKKQISYEPQLATGGFGRDSSELHGSHLIETNVGLEKIEEMIPEPSEYNTSTMHQFDMSTNPMTEFAKKWGESKMGRKSTQMRIEREQALARFGR